MLATREGRSRRVPIIDDELTVTDDLRSLPSGQLQDAPTGAKVTVREAAQGMIEISDNTATDLLIDAVGRQAVEQALASMGHDDSASNTPLPSTRELFALGWGGGDERRAAWRDADPAERRGLLADLPGGVLQLDLTTIQQTVVWPFDVNWFATGADLCAAHVALYERAATAAGEPVREILAANAGIARDPQAPGAVTPDVWPYVAFKGGSSTGTMGGSWYAKRTADDADGGPTRVVVVLQTASRTAQDTVPAPTLVGIAQDALRLAASED